VVRLFASFVAPASTSSWPAHSARIRSSTVVRARERIRKPPCAVSQRTAARSGGAGVGDERPTVGTDRQLGQSDPDVPALPPGPLRDPPDWASSVGVSGSAMRPTVTRRGRSLAEGTP
jgi:hypothetical protein